MRPRASRLPGLKEVGAFTDSLRFASKASRWLDDEHLVKGAGRTNWKQQYKLRHNWTRGSCAVNEIPVAEEAAIPPILVQMHDGVIYTVDQTDELRAWSAKGPRDMIAQAALPPTRSAPPTALAVDSKSVDDESAKVIIGFEDGSFALYLLNRTKRTFRHKYTHAASSNGVVSSVALEWPYAGDDDSNATPFTVPIRLHNSGRRRGGYNRSSAATALLEVAHSLAATFNNFANVSISDLHLCCICPSNVSFRVDGGDSRSQSRSRRSAVGFEIGLGH